MRFRALRIVTLVAAAAVVGPVVTGCSSDDSSGTQSPGDEVESDGESVVTADPNDTDNPAAFDFTSTISITETGFEPRQAVAVLGEMLTFVNNTDRAQTIRFTNGTPNVDGAPTIGPIEPGESLSFPEPLESTISLIYESDGLPGQQGQLQVDPGIEEL